MIVAGSTCDEDARCREKVSCKDEGTNGIKADRERSADEKPRGSAYS